MYVLVMVRGHGVVIVGLARMKVLVLMLIRMGLLLLQMGVLRGFRGCDGLRCRCTDVRARLVQMAKQQVGKSSSPCRAKSAKLTTRAKGALVRVDE